MPKCEPCSYSCLSCDATGCLSCNPSNHRTLTGKTCPCNSGYYNSNTNPLCLLCNPSCKTCTQQDQCVDCPDNSDFISTPGLCKCKDGFYRDTTTNKCQPCAYYCETCTSPNLC